MELTLDLPEPPSVNEMLSLAMKRTRRSRTGGWMRRAVPGVVYDQAHEAYEAKCLAATRTAGVRFPAEPWPRWRIVTAEFRLHNLRDRLELMAGLKWPVDWLVHHRVVAGDAPHQLLGPLPDPVQTIARRRRGVTLTIAPAP